MIRPYTQRDLDRLRGGFGPLVGACRGRPSGVAAFDPAAYGAKLYLKSQSGGNWIDSSGAGHNFSMDNGATLSDDATYGTVGVFDGTNDIASCADHADFYHATKFSWAAWCYVDSGHGSGFASFTWINLLGGLGWNPSNQKFYWSVGNGGAAYTDAIGGTVYAKGAWYHVAGTWDHDASNPQMRLYVNGTQDATANNTNTPSNGTQNVGIGARHYAGSDGEWTKGKVGKVLWAPGVCWTAGQVSEIKNLS